MKPNPQDEMIALLDAVEVKVVRRNGSTVPVKVRKLGVRHLRKFGELSAQAEDGEIIKLCTGVSDEWIDSLNNESALKLATACKEANSDFFAAWLGNTRKDADAFLPKLASSVSPAGAPTPPPDSTATST